MAAAFRQSASIASRATQTLGSRVLPRSHRSPSIFPHSASPPRSYSSSSHGFNQTLTLPSSRGILGYHTSGPSTGTPVIYIHGTPDSGAQVLGSLETKVAHDLNIRWIGPDRPGIGLSTFQPERKVMDYSDDIQSLVDHLGLKEFYLLGTSGGTGFTLAAAKALSKERLKGVGLCACVGPWEGGLGGCSWKNKIGVWMWRHYPSLITGYLEKYVRLAREGDQGQMEEALRKDFGQGLKGKDREYMLEKGNLESVARSFRQVYSQGTEGAAMDYRLNLNPWGFKVEDAGFEGVKLWYGEKDGNTSPKMGKAMAAKLPHSVYKEYPGRSHFTIWDEKTLPEFLRALVGIEKTS